MISTSEKTSLEYKISSDEGNYSIVSESNKSDNEFAEQIDSDLYRKHVCSLCQNSFTSKKVFFEHLAIHGIKIPQDYSVSNVPENDRDSELSLQKIENTNSNTTLVVRPFKCNLCGLVFDRISQYDNHRRSVHSQERSQVCQICGKGFFRQTDLKTHLNIHLGTNRCVCEICGRKFNHVSNLTRHSRTHSGVKPYPCTICGKRFTQINTLARHKAIHKRGDEIMDCSFCDKRYKSESGLKEHMRKLHRFTEKANGENHINSRIIKRQHYCKICGESFQFVELLRVHEEIHRNVKSLECKSCRQKFQKADEIKEHRCGRVKLFSANIIKSTKISQGGMIKNNKSSSNSFRENESVLTQLVGTNENSTEQLSLSENHKAVQNQKTNELKNFVDHELGEKLCPETVIDSNSNKLAEDKQTKETIVYVTTEQLANMNTEQVVDTANHFLHQHLMELAAESSSQTDNIGSRDCDGETVVSEMIKNCWKEIEMPDVIEPEILEKRDSLSSKNNTQSIIYIHALEKDSLILLNEMGGNSIENLMPDLTPEKSMDLKNNLNTEPESVQTVKVCVYEYAKKHSLDTIQNENPSKKLSCNFALHDNTDRNFKERNTGLTVTAMRGAKIESSRNYFSEEISIENQQIPTETTNASLTHNTLEELFRNNTANTNNAIVSKSSENQESTGNGEEFYELLITNCSGKTENSFEFDRIPMTNTTNGNENSRTAENNAVMESLSKLVQLENGQRVLESRRSSLADETENCVNTENIVQATEKNTFVETSSNVLESAEQDESRVKNLAQSRCEKIFYLAQNNKDNMIDFFEIETLETQEQNSFNLVSEEVMENVSQQTSFDHLQTLNRHKSSVNDESPIDNESCEDLLGLIQSNPMKYNEKNKMESKQSKKEEGPMVRLVQNEDGAQFFELIRGDLDFEETENFELVETNLSEEKQIPQVLNNSQTSMNFQLESTSTINDGTKLETDTNRKKKQKSSSKTYNCDVCKKSFSKGYNYRQHIGTHFADQQKFKCKECGTLFAWKSTLNKHMATHRAGGQQKFVCEICPKVYTTLSQVNEHVKRDHLKERNHKCVHCGKTFFKKFDLKIHIRTHTKERPYECSVCYKSFHHQSHIIRHERIHSGERPYACSICEKTFTQLGSLKNHRHRHQELKIDILDYQMDEDDPLPQTTF